LVACLPNEKGGQVKGALEADDIGPMEGVPVSLTDFRETDDGWSVAYVHKDGLTQGTVALTRTNGGGKFLFEDLPTGNYALVVFSKAMEDIHGNLVICEVTKGHVLNLGTIRFVNARDGKYRYSYAGPPKTPGLLWAAIIALPTGLAYLAYRWRAHGSSVRIKDLQEQDPLKKG
jgi:hypothetical protein